LNPEGFLKVNGLSIYYRSEGEAARGTILALHGGPGGTYDYIVPLFGLAGKEYRVVMYDQSGGGKSELLKDTSLYTIERYVEEVEGVRRALRLGRIHLYGHSWGGMLAQAYALKYQSNLASLILSGTTSSIPLCEVEVERVVSRLPPDVRKNIVKYESDGNFEAPEYLAAVDEFNRRHQCRLQPWPETVKFTFSHFSLPVEKTMFGLHTVKVTGNMRYWDVTRLLPTLRVPCLIICGELDFLTPKLHRILHSRIRGSKLVVMKGASHASMWEKRDAYIKAVRDFLDLHQLPVARA
jgi:proline iminopeptidase